MNLFDILNSNHKVMDLITPETMNLYISQSGVVTNKIKVRYDELDISITQVALLLTYAGNINGCLPERDYSQFHSILALALRGLQQGLKTNPMTTTVTKLVLKTAGY